jgi:ubiquinol-cytochrome c reductase subunit 7
MRKEKLMCSVQCSLQHQLLPKSDWTTDEQVRHLSTSFLLAHSAYKSALDQKHITYIIRTQDYEYLSPIIKEIEKERSEREDLESMVVKKPIPGAK